MPGRHRNWHATRCYERQGRWGDYIYIYAPYPTVVPSNEGGPHLVSIKKAFDAGKATVAQSHPYISPRPIEQLFDTKKDPHQLKDLAGNPEFAAPLKHLRGIVKRWQKETGDTQPPMDKLTPSRKKGGPRDPVRGDVPGATANAVEVNASGPILK